MSVKLIKQNKSFDGYTKYFEHDSEFTKTSMKFSTYIPEGKVENCIIWLSGLTCNEENFISKAGAQRFLSGTNTMIICPDTSPRGLELLGEHDSYDFGSGAGFYINAKTEGYRDHYNMYDYISLELVGLLKTQFNIKNISVMGHSMGGHGALILGLKEPTLFKSVSAFSPIVNPSQCEWGKKAFTGYLGSNEQEWKQYDATELILSGYSREQEILVEQGLDDEFLEKELLTKNFQVACSEKGQGLKVNYREGYDHSYYFISTFIEDHIKFHLEALG